ncbi:MAG: hypothetical protein WCO18_02680 [bacterium]
MTAPELLKQWEEEVSQIMSSLILLVEDKTEEARMEHGLLCLRLVQMRDKCGIGTGCEEFDQWLQNEFRTNYFRPLPAFLAKVQVATA